MEKKDDKFKEAITRRVTRRQTLKAGSLMAMGLVFTKPHIDTIFPKQAYQAVSPPSQPKPTTPCTAFIDPATAAISGPGTDGTSLQAGNTYTYTASVPDYSCGNCSDGTCNDSIQFSWSENSTNQTTVQILSPNSQVTDVIPDINLAGSGFGMAQIELQCLVTLRCGSGPCEDIDQVLLTTTINLFT